MFNEITLYETTTDSLLSVVAMNILQPKNMLADLWLYQ